MFLITEPSTTNNRNNLMQKSFFEERASHREKKTTSPTLSHTYINILITARPLRLSAGLVTLLGKELGPVAL